MDRRFSKPLDKIVSEFNSSISVDGRMYKEDILGSIAHVKMLANQGIIAAGEAEKIAAELAKISEEIEAGELEIDSDAEDIHSFIEGELTRRLGESGKRLHTARSRNDQVATDTRLYVKGKFPDFRRPQIPHRYPLRACGGAQRHYNGGIYPPSDGAADNLRQPPDGIRLYVCEGFGKADGLP